MRKIHICALFLAACTLIACDHTCPVSGNPNTTYNYSYLDGASGYRFGSFTTDEYGKADVSNVPDNVDCSRLAFSAAGDHASDMLDPPQS